MSLQIISRIISYIGSFIPYNYYNNSSIPLKIATVEAPPVNLEPEAIFNKDDIPIGTCVSCGKRQSQLAGGGYWINGLKNKWICFTCKYIKSIPSYPTACEWCTYDYVIWYQGHTYDCPRCKYLSIGQYAVTYY